MSRTMLMVNGQVVEQGALMYFAGTPYAQLRLVFQALGGTVTWQNAEAQAVVTWRNNLLIVPATGRHITLNGQQRTFAEAHRIIEGRLCVSLEDLARAFLGSLRMEGEALYLFLPVGLLTGISIGSESLVLHWTGQVKASPLGGDDPSALSLQGTSWGMPLRRVIIEQALEGHLIVRLEAEGRELDFNTGEQGLRVSWPGRPQKLRGFIIALDAGHGGKQPGAVGVSGVLEKDLARQVVDLLRVPLRAAGAEVVDIRQGDEHVSLNDRVNRSRMSRASIFISVHYNAHERRTANGTETFHAAGNVLGARLAALVQEELLGALQLRDRGVKVAAFHVLRGQPSIAAVLAEIGFLTNPEEEEFLIRPATLQKTAEALYRAIVRYFS
ncbi:MAG: N-acetylmuramoyl-L-alanine amidase, partial [Peptococcaceae bacterium]|nr:N-acetylmuramoyl-L-alanine amidase [Peptococcaceae bacterium]